MNIATSPPVSISQILNRSRSPENKLVVQRAPGHHPPPTQIPTILVHGRRSWTSQPPTSASFGKLSAETPTNWNLTEVLCGCSSARCSPSAPALPLVVYQNLECIESPHQQHLQVLMKAMLVEVGVGSRQIWPSSCCPRVAYIPAAADEGTISTRQR